MSPIHNLTNTPPAFIKLGRIKKGDRLGKNNAPRDLDHFRITFQPGTNAADLEKAFFAAYEKEPKELNVRFASHNPDDVWSASYECYKKGGLVAKASSNENGAYWEFYRDPETSEVLISGGMPRGEAGRAFIEKPVDVTAPIYFNQAKEPQYMKPTGRLQVVIPELTRIGTKAVVGFFEFCPRSPRDIRNISGELAMYAAFAKAAGKTINGVPFKLIRRQEDVTKKIEGKIVQDKSWVCHLDCSGEWGRLALEAVERLALPDVVEGEYYDDEDFPEEAPKLSARNAPQPVATSESGELCDPLDDVSVKWAAYQWNIGETKARAQIAASNNFYNPMLKSTFKSLVLEGVKK